MSRTTEKNIEVLREMILRAANPQCIVLFGSRARGDARTDSDYALMIVEPGEFESPRARWAELRRIRKSLEEADVPADILLVSRCEVDKWRQSVNHVIARGLNEGHVLHGSL